MKAPISQKQFVINNLRRASYRWPAKNQCKTAAKVGYNQYKCNICNNIFPNKDVRVDHKIPVVCPIAGYIDYNTYIDRLFCGVENLQVLCTTCHDLKSYNEKQIRVLNKKPSLIIRKKMRKNKNHTK